MCRYCVEYGNGTKWYLNPANYNPELFQAPGHNSSWDMLSGTFKNSLEVGAMRYSPLDHIAHIHVSQCFGCGLCRPLCPTKAIQLVDRMTYPALVDVW